MNSQQMVIIRDVPVSFPFQPYPIQLRYMEKVIEALQTGKNALLESPTGSGKTLCLLCATLAWRATLQSVITPGQPQRGPPLIIFASRTHSQLQQALKQLKMTAYKPRVSIVASRDALCVHPKISAQYSGTQLNQQCQAVHITRRCQFSNNLDEFQRSNPHFTDEIFDIEDMVYIGQEHEICPYYMALDNAKQADFLFVPYNYVVDPKLRKNLSLEVRLEKAIVIFDEAHNMESSCTDSSSFDFTAQELAKCILDADFCVNACSQPNYNPPNNVVLEIEHIVTAGLLLKERLLSLQAVIAKVELGQDRGATHPGSFLQTLLSRAGFDLDDPHLDRLLEAMANVCTTRNDNEPSLRQLREYLSILKRAVSGNILNHYRVHIHEATQIETKPKKGFSRSINEGRILSFWCFSSGVTMKELAALGVHSLLLTSGTLSPLPALKLELDVAFPVVLENEHVIGRDQLYLGLIRKGPDGLSLNSSFKNRNRPECIAELGNLIAQFAQIVPDGLLVFFPSYPAMSAALDGWKRSPVMNRIETYKRVFVEPRQQSELKGCMGAYQEAIAQGRGAILMAVCRGKISEGVDFSDRAARGVIICGLPYAATQAPRVRLKRIYLDSTTRSHVAGAEWYQTQAWRAVNQALGRVIRHRDDFGAILLCDERFCGDGGAHLSLWLRRFIQTPPSFAEATNQLRQFFGQPHPVKEASKTSGSEDRMNDPRLSQIHPISSLYNKFRLNRMQCSSNGVSGSQPGTDSSLSRPIKMRPRDWGQYVPSSTAAPSNGSVSLQRSNSLPKHIPNLLAISNSNDVARQSSVRSAPNLLSRQDSGSSLHGASNVLGLRVPGAQPLTNSGLENRDNSNAHSTTGQGVTVMSRDTAQVFVNLLKSNVVEGGWKPISAAIRDASLLKHEESPDPKLVHTTLQRLYKLIDQIPDSKKLNLHKQMQGYLPAKFRSKYQDFQTRAYSDDFKRLVRRKSEDGYKRFCAAVNQMTKLYREVKQRDSEHVNKLRSWSDDEQVQFRHYCREIVDVLLPLDRTWPEAFQRFLLIKALAEIYKECLTTATAELSLVSQGRPQPGGATDGKRSLSPSLDRTCQFCGSAAKIALRSTICRHVGCSDCWMSHLKLFKSCLCNQPLSKGKLEKLQY